jgi:hypothetical protein
LLRRGDLLRRGNVLKLGGLSFGLLLLLLLLLLRRSRDDVYKDFGLATNLGAMYGVR